MARGREGVMDDPQFNRLMDLARSGDEAALATLVRSFEADVRLIVRGRLPQALRGQFDSMDFVQAVWQSVLSDPETLGAGFDGAGHFRGYLAGVARNKVLEEYRRRTQSRKYDVGREEPLYVRRGGRDQPREVASPDPTPSQEAQAGDTLDRLVAGRSPREAEVVELRRQALTFAEIAERTGLHERAVRRIIEEVRTRHDREEGHRWR
jgi:RNA polymerase sigma factor (sigma-70 family)